jgi:hypothetical protein
VESQPGQGGLHEAVSGVARELGGLGGKNYQSRHCSQGKQGAAVLVCTDGTFTIVPPMAPEPYELGEALAVARTILEPTHQTAYVEYDRLVKKDRDALRSARVEKILGAIHNNLEQIRN